MEVEQLQKTFLEHTSALLREGVLDNQFKKLQDESNPHFVFEVVSLYIDHSQRLLNDLTLALEQQNVDFKKVDFHIHELKGSSSWVGAQGVKNACIAFRNFCKDQNEQECMRCLQQLKEDYLQFKAKLEVLLQLEKQIVSAGGAIPMFE